MLTEPVNASLPTNDKIAQLIGHQLVIAREHADVDGQIETQPLLLDIRRHEIDGGPARGNCEPGIGQRRADAVAIPSSHGTSPSEFLAHFTSSRRRP